MTAATQIGASVCNLIATVVPRRPGRNAITPDMALRRDLDVDSLGLLTIVFALEEGLHLDLSAYATRVTDAQRVADLIEICRLAAVGD